tara:strand:- start:580 stop:1308 length:729 start_codon:yes stop_codon:yes gene_type:complete
MINKNIVQSIINKYFLKGLNNTVKWRIKDNTLTIYAGSSGNLCKVYLNNFQLEDCELAIFDTDKLNKLISITNGDLLIEPIKSHKIYTKINISDANFDLSYSLADVTIIGKDTWLEDPKNGYELETELSVNDIDSLIKAKNALSEVDHMLIKTSKSIDGAKVCEFLFGDDANYANKITFQTPAIFEENISLPFNSSTFKDILSANKDMDKGLLKLTKEGYINLNFISEGLGITSEYFLVRNE